VYDFARRRADGMYLAVDMTKCECLGDHCEGLTDTRQYSYPKTEI